MIKLTMVLAQAPWAPDGDVEDHLTMHVGLNNQGRIDQPGYDADAQPWIATRHQPGQHVRTGRLVRAGEGWALRSMRGDDEPLWDFIGDLMRPGEVVTVRQPDGADLLFRIVAVDAAPVTQPAIP